MPKIERFDGCKTNINPSIHFVDRGGVRVYRVWDHRCDEYITEEMSHEELQDWQLHRALLTTIREDAHPRMLHFRDLGNKGWWTDEVQPRGVVEQHTEIHDFDFAKQCEEAWRNATVALMAIKAYQAHVQGGGDPSQLPIMSFEAGRFAVALKNENDD